MCTVRLCVVLALLAGVLPAQSRTTITPKDAVGAGKNTPGVSALGFGFNLWAHRVQQIHNHDSFTHGASPFVMRQIGFRKPAGRNTGNEGGATIEFAMDLALGAAGVTATSHSTTYANNADAATKRRVFAMRSIKLPVLGSPMNPSLGFDFKLPFDQAFVYTPTQKRALIIDLYKYDPTSGAANYFVDGWTRARSGIGGAVQAAILFSLFDTNSTFGTSGPNGTYGGCQSSAKQTVTHASSGKSILVGHLHVFTGSSSVANLAGAMSLGATPIDVTLPGTQCKIVNDLVLLFGFVADANGDARLEFPMPPIAALAGASFLTQMFFLDGAANAVGIVSSNGLKHTIGKGFPDSVRSSTQGRALIVEFSQ